MADPTDLSHLDTETLRKFVDTDVEGFVKALIDLTTDTANPYVPCMLTLSNQVNKKDGTGTVPKLGKLGAPEGPLSPLVIPLVDLLKSASTSLAKVEKDQLTLFNDLKRELGAVITDMENTQKKNLEDIESKKFLNDLRTVDTGLAPPPKT
ncbi:type VII secretion system-associated protein [Streptomyces sp. 21So2-11]|uniref:type VII secretion system-associated protein n=1 Tax=Streptomyces sp. 21So2-11 TaxID=3144408 RepID=UPI00321A11EC